MAKSDAIPDDTDEAMAIYQNCMECEPAINPAEMDDLANLVFDKGFVIRPWRLTALIASEGGDFFRKFSEDETMAKAFAPSIRPLECFAETMRHMADLADCCRARMQVAGCNHKDFLEWEKLVY